MEDDLPKISDRAKAITPSLTIQLSDKILSLKKEGKSVIPMHIGEIDLNSSELIINSTITALNNGKTKYGEVAGISSLRKLIINKLKRINNIDSEMNNIFVGIGSKQVLYNIFQTILNKNDEVIVLAPYWVSYPESIKLADGNPIIVNMSKKLTLDLIKIENAITSKTKAIIINSPNNPSGLMYSKEELTRIGHLATLYNLLIISDEAYESLAFDRPHISIASISKEIAERTFSVFTFSKSFNMTGFRLGYLSAPSNYIEAIINLQGQLTGNPNSFAQYGAIAALENYDVITEEIKLEMKKRFLLAIPIIDSIFGNTESHGGLYLFPSCKKYISNKYPTDISLALAILETKQVSLVPGSYFGCKDRLRICLTTNYRDLEIGLNRIKDFFKEIDND